MATNAPVGLTPSVASVNELAEKTNKKAEDAASKEEMAASPLDAVMTTQLDATTEAPDRTWNSAATSAIFQVRYGCADVSVYPPQSSQFFRTC